MIDRQHGKIIIECDACPSTFEGEKGDEWSATWPAAMADGWKSRKIAGEWMHFCSRCKP